MGQRLLLEAGAHALRWLNQDPSRLGVAQTTDLADQEHALGVRLRRRESSRKTRKPRPDHIEIPVPLTRLVLRRYERSQQFSIEILHFVDENREGDALLPQDSGNIGHHVLKVEIQVPRRGSDRIPLDPQ